MAKTLGLGGDGDEVELVEEIERSFGIRFDNVEPERWLTVGDMYDDLVKRLEKLGPDSGRKCATAMSFYALRRALALSVPSIRLTPDTPLAAATSLTPKRLLKSLSELTGLRVPDHSLSAGVGGVGCALVVLSILAMFFAFQLGGAWWFIPTIAFPAGQLLMKLDKGLFPPGIEAFGDLAQRVAFLNFAKFLTLGASKQPRTVWNALVAIIAQHETIDPTSIEPETRFIA